MCPFCNNADKTCKVSELPNGRLVCECGLHAWPNSAVYAESCRRANLTVVRTVHTWTQGY